MNTLRYAVRTLVDWFTRRHMLGGVLIRVGLAIAVVALGANYAVKLHIPTTNGAAFLDLSTGGASDIITIIALAVAFAFIVTGALLWWRRDAKLDQHLVLVVEGRSLGGVATPLADAVPAEIRGHREPRYIRADQGDGKILAPEPIVGEITSLRSDLARRVEGHGDRSEVTLVYGGTTAVPFTFLTGLLFDDMCSVIAMDWDREREAWRMLDDEDDGKRLTISGLDQVRDAKEVVLAVAVSYPVTDSDLATTFSYPVVRMELEGRGTHSHWSSAKQAALAMQLFELAKGLADLGVERIHLVLAAQNSVVFRIGRGWDKRNLPDIVVHQYDRSTSLRYPWGVLMPAGTVQTPSIVRPSAPVAMTSSGTV